jgi:hypothetical protein
VPESGFGLWAAIDHDDRIIALGEFAVENDANVWFSRLQRGRTVVPLALLPGEVPRVGDPVRVDAEWTGQIGRAHV